MGQASFIMHDEQDKRHGVVGLNIFFNQMEGLNIFKTSTMKAETDGHQKWESGIKKHMIDRKLNEKGLQSQL